MREPTAWRRWQRRALDVIRALCTTARSTGSTTGGGAAGKSFLCKFMVCNYEALFLSGAKLADAAMAYNGQPIVVFDIPRSTPGDFVNYGTIETIKNGMVFQGLKSPSSS